MAQREAIVDAAFETLLAEGPGFPVASVAARAGVSKALVFHHFGDREGLLDAMAERVLRETREGLDRLASDYPNPRDRLAALARALLEPPERPEDARRVLLFWLAEDDRGRPRAALRDALLADFAQATVREGVAAGAMRQGADGRAVADALLARWHGLTALVAAGREVDHDREQERLVRDLAALAFPDGSLA